MIADGPSFSVCLSRRIQIWDGKQKVAVEIQKSLCEGRKTENLIESTCFNLKNSRVHVFVRILVECACFAMTII